MYFCPQVDIQKQKYVKEKANGLTDWSRRLQLISSYWQNNS